MFKSIRNKVVMAFAALSVAVSGASAINFSFLTDFVNATVTVLDTFVNNGDTFLNAILLFAIMGAIGGIVTIIFVKLFGKMLGGVSK